MQRTRLFRYLPLLALFPWGTAPEVDARPRRPKPPLILKVEKPVKGAVQYRSGWPLEFSMRPRSDDYTLGMNAGSAMYPPLELRSFIVFRDLDGCLSVLDRFVCPPPPPGDELVFAFTPDHDQPGVLDFGPGGAIRDIQTDPRNAPGFIYDNQLRFLGPRPSGVRDGIGYGPNEDLPGFVVLSNVGAGLVLENELGAASAVNPDGFLEVMPRRRRNLAGLMTEVSFELVSGGKKPTSVVRTSLLVPPHLFAQYRLIDFCVGGTRLPNWGCDGGIPQERIEGSRDVVPSNRWDDEFSSDPNLPSTNVAHVELRAFVVEGDAPVFVEDCNLDDRVTAEDAVCMGYSLLSNQVVVRFRQMGNHEDGCSLPFNGRWLTGGTWIEIDFDGDGFDPGSQCPSGGGRVSRPPM